MVLSQSITARYFYLVIEMVMALMCAKHMYSPSSLTQMWSITLLFMNNQGCLEALTDDKTYQDFLIMR